MSLMRPRDNDDDSEEGYQNWPFMSVQTWGETPHGRWKLKVFDDVSFRSNKVVQDSLDVKILFVASLATCYWEMVNQINSQTMHPNII